MKKTVMLSIVLAVLAVLALPLYAVESAPIGNTDVGAAEKKMPAEPAPAAVGTEAGAEEASVKPAIQVAPVMNAAANPGQTLKIGYVDMAKVAGDSASGKAAAAEIKSRVEKLRKQIEAKQKQLEKQKGDIEAKLQTLNPQQRAAQVKEFQKKLEDFQKFVEKTQKDLQTKEAELLGKLFAAIEKAAGEYGKANGFAAVVVKKELLYVGEKVETADLTDEIIKMVNAADKNKKLKK